MKTYTVENRSTLSTTTWPNLLPGTRSLGARPYLFMVDAERKKFVEMERLGITECAPRGWSKLLVISDVG